MDEMKKRRTMNGLSKIKHRASEIIGLSGAGIIGIHRRVNLLKRP